MSAVTPLDAEYVYEHWRDRCLAHDGETYPAWDQLTEQMQGHWLELARYALHSYRDGQRLYYNWLQISDPTSTTTWSDIGPEHRQAWRELSHFLVGYRTAHLRIGA